ncbi:hypothetical protein D3C80_1317760 [compost metagenome]
MLRRDAVGHFDGLFHVANLDQCTTAIDRSFDDCGTLHGRHQLGDAGGDLVEEPGVGADQNGLGVFVVLGLGEQVHGNPVRIGLAVAHHEDFRRAGDHVDADLAKHVALGGSHIDVARADDLVDLRHAFGAVSQRRNSLGAADGEHAVDTGDAGCSQHKLVDFTARGRYDHDHFGNTGHLGRNRVHQH